MKKILLFLALFFGVTVYCHAQQYKVRINVPEYSHTYPQNSSTGWPGETLTLPSINREIVIPGDGRAHYTDFDDIRIAVVRNAAKWIVDIYHLDPSNNAYTGLLQIVHQDVSTPLQVVEFTGEAFTTYSPDWFPSVGYAILTIGDLDIDDEGCECTSCNTSPGSDSQKFNGIGQPDIKLPFGNKGTLRWFGQYYHLESSPNITDPKHLFPVEQEISEKIEDANGVPPTFSCQ